MEIVSVNLGKKRIVQWRGKSIETGIFKEPVDQSVFLGTTDVEGDDVVDRKYHGGLDKACYLYSADHYSDWKHRYLDLDWNWGMFGENLTVAGLDETKVMIGDRFAVGSAIVEASEPRQPCFKLGIRFGTQQVLKDFIRACKPGVYMRVIQPGEVQVGDSFNLIKTSSSISITDVFKLLYGLERNEHKLKEALQTPQLAESTRKDLLK